MRWLFYEKESDTRAKVTLIYYAEPPEELTSAGNFIAVDNMAEPEKIDGKVALPYCNPQDGTMWYEYVDVPETPEIQRIKELESQNAQMLLALVEGGLM